MFVVKTNYCNCHPETCCCDDYKIVSTATGEKYITGNNEKTLQEICNLKNKSKQAKGETK